MSDTNNRSKYPHRIDLYVTDDLRDGVQRHRERLEARVMDAVDVSRSMVVRDLLRRGIASVEGAGASKQAAAEMVASQWPDDADEEADGE